MEPGKPVFWYQGLFLQPQHFQQFDLYIQSLVFPLQTYLQSNFWGICRMQVHQAAFKNLTFEIVEGEFIFPDGTWTIFPGNSVIQPRSLKTEELEAGIPFKVYLGLRRWSRISENVSILDNIDNLHSVGTRFISRAEPEEVKDVHQGGPSGHVKFINYVLKIFLENELDKMNDYLMFPIAQLEYDGEQIKVSRNFVPPSVSISSSEVLQQILQNICEQITSSCRKLEEYKTPKEIQTSEIETSYIIYLLALRSLNRYVPLLHHVTAVNNIHPWHVYGLLRQIIGELSTFTNRIDALGRLIDGTQLLPDYNHENLSSCFVEAQTLIGELLSAISIGPEKIVHLEREGDYFKAQIPEEVFENRNVFYLVVRTAESQSKVLEVMQHVAKVSSIDFMEILITRSLSGIPLEYSLIPPPGLPTRPNSFYFKLDQTHQQWLEIQKNQSICLYWIKAPKDTQAELIVLRK